MTTKPTLFFDRREFVYFMAIAFVLFLLHLGWRYLHYRDFVSLPFYYTEASVKTLYLKKKRHSIYKAAKLHTKEGLRLYTTWPRFVDARKGDTVRIKLTPDKRYDFVDFLTTGYLKSRMLRILKRGDSAKARLREKIAAQHDRPDIAALYGALFFASEISASLRRALSGLGVNHLTALSGLHLTILWGVLYGVLTLLYTPLQRRFWLYRYRLFDVGAATLLLAGIYVWFVGAPPSLVRAYAMLASGWALTVLGIDVWRVTFLFSVIALLLAIFPDLAFSLGFWFSFFGVYFIYLLLHYFKATEKPIVASVVIAVGVFVLMLPITHLFFPETSRWQLLSPLLSLLFTLFYPLSILLHAIGAGGLFDTALTKLLTLPQTTTFYETPLAIGILYVVAALAAMRYRTAWYLTWGIAVVFALRLYLF